VGVELALEQIGKQYRGVGYKEREMEKGVEMSPRHPSREKST
jgi:hypothetical protein